MQPHRARRSQKNTDMNRYTLRTSVPDVITTFAASWVLCALDGLASPTSAAIRPHTWSKSEARHGIKTMAASRKSRITAKTSSAQRQPDAPAAKPANTLRIRSAIPPVIRYVNIKNSVFTSNAPKRHLPSETNTSVTRLIYISSTRLNIMCRTSAKKFILPPARPENTIGVGG